MLLGAETCMQWRLTCLDFVVGTGSGETTGDGVEVEAEHFKLAMPVDDAHPPTTHRCLWIEYRLRRRLPQASN